MTDENSKQDSETPSRNTGGHGRSPGYPYISLEKAMERAQQLKEAEGFYAVPMSSAFKAWGISPTSSASPQVLAALKHFGLLEYEGSGANRLVRLTDLARRIILDVRPDSPDKPSLIKQAALTPPIHRDILEKFPDGLPSDTTLQTYLVLEKSFNEKGAQALISEFKDTISFAKIGSSGTIPKEPDGTGDDETPPTDSDIMVGDLVQIEINGAFQLEVPKSVRAIQEYEGKDWVFIEGTETGFPMEQVVRQERPNPAEIVKPAFSGIAPRLPIEKDDMQPDNIREDKASLDEGSVLLRWPENLSQESVEDFEYWIKGIVKRAKRRAGMDAKKDEED